MIGIFSDHAVFVLWAYEKDSIIYVEKSTNMEGYHGRQI